MLDPDVICDGDGDDDVAAENVAALAISECDC
jgi:hypothetical protein